MSGHSFLTVIVFLLLLACSGGEGWAQTQPEESFQLDQVVVTATRTEQKLKDIPANVTVLTEEDIQQSAAQTVDDLLRQVPGFSLLRQSGSLANAPTNQSVSLRGLGGTSASRTLVLLDGVPVNDPFGGWVYWGRIPRENIERIEVVRGGGSAVWGNLALGGVINVITEKPQGRTFKFTTYGGNRGTTNVDFLASDFLGPLIFSVGGNYFNTGGYNTVRADQRGPIDENTDSEHKTFNGKLEYPLSPNALLSLQGSFFTEDRHEGTPLGRNSTDTGFVRGGADFTTPDGSSWQVGAFSHLQTYKNFSASVAEDRQSERPSLNQFDVPSTTVGTTLQWSKPFTKLHLLTAGTDFQWIAAETNEDSRFIGNQFTRRRKAGGEQELAGIYLQDIFAPTPRWQVVVAGRLDVWRNFAGSRRDRDLQTGATVREETFSERTKVTFNPSIGLLYRATDRFSLRGSFYRSFRAPTINELYKPFAARGNVVTEANAALDPERLLGGEAGIDYIIAPGFLGRLTGFWSEVENPIVNVTIEEAGRTGRDISPCGFVPAGGVCRQRQNLDRLRTRGVELELEYRPHMYWTLSGSYLFDDTEVLSAPNQPQLEGKRARQVPKHQFVLQLRYNNPSLLNVSLQGRYVAKRFEDDLNSLQVGDFFLVDLLLSRQLMRGWEVFFAVENLFDRTYEDTKSADGIVGIGPPLLVHGGFRFRF